MSKETWRGIAIGALLTAAISITPAFAGALDGIASKKKKKKAKVVRGPAGPAGPAGTQGPAGPQGERGTARAYAYVAVSACDASIGDNECVPAASNGTITRVRRISLGQYCITAPGVDARTVPAAVTVDNLDTDSSVADGADATFNSFAGLCGDDSQFGVTTTRIDKASHDTLLSDDVAFTIVIP